MTSSLFRTYSQKLPKKIIEEIKENISDNISEKRLQKILDAATEAYEKAQVDAGECVGLVSAESIGEPGTQMCIAYDEKVLLKQDGSICTVNIGELVDSVLDSGIYPVGKKGGYEFCDANGISVLALNDDEKLEWRHVSKLNRHKRPKKLVRITTKSGRKITATDFHSFVTRKNNKIIPIAGKYLKIGDRIPVIRYLPENCTEAINVYEYVCMPANDFRLKREYRPTKLLPLTFDLDWNFGWFIGAYLAEGTALFGQLCISNLDDAYIGNAKLFVKKIGLDFAEKCHHRGFAPSRDFIVNSSLLARFVRNTCGTGSANKKVPDFAFSAKEEFVAGLLRGYFDGDGNFAVNRKMIRASSNSEELLDGIKLLLARFGIFAFKSRDRRQHYLIIPCKYSAVFMEKVGSDIQHKKCSLAKLAELSKNITEKYQEYTDMIGGFDDVLVDISKKLGLPTRRVNSATKRQKIGRTVLLNHITAFENKAREKNINVSSELGILKKMAYSDIVWDEVEKIESIKPIQKYVYDLTVPGLHTFATFDGIITHNTLNTFHFAGVSEMNVTVGLPRIIEILDGRSTISTPMMEIYLNAPHNKGKDIRTIALSLKETKLKDVASDMSIDLAEATLEITIDEPRAEECGIKTLAIVKLLEKGLKGINVTKDKNKIIIKPKGKNEGMNELFKLKEKLKEAHIAGIKGITQVLPVKKEEEFIIITAGSNMKEILAIDYVDSERTTTNNIQEVADVLGVEAARAMIINEITKVIETQGLNVDVRHIMLAADTMCLTGEVKGITRYGVVGEKASVLARASFETPIRHIIQASLIGEEDHLNSVIENVMLNQPVPVGTGLPGLITKVKNK